MYILIYVIDSSYEFVEGYSKKHKTLADYVQKLGYKKRNGTFHKEGDFNHFKISKIIEIL